MSFLEIQSQFFLTHCGRACTSLDPAISHHRALYLNSKPWRHFYFSLISLLSRCAVSLNYQLSRCKHCGIQMENDRSTDTRVAKVWFSYLSVCLFFYVFTGHGLAGKDAKIHKAAHKLVCLLGWKFPAGSDSALTIFFQHGLVSMGNRYRMGWVTRSSN